MLVTLAARPAGGGPPRLERLGRAPGARRRRGGRRSVGCPRGRHPAGRDRRTRARGRLRHLDPVARLLARRRRQVGGDRRGAGGRGRGPPDRPGAPLRRPLVASRQRRGGAPSRRSSSGSRPVVLAPLFNKFTALPADSQARAEVLSLARRAGVDIGQVYRVDASRRVRSLNAYVDGIGSDQAGRPLRQPAPPRQPARAAKRRRPRARPREARRRPAGPRLPDHRHAARAAVRAASWGGPRRRIRGRPARPGGASRLPARARAWRP